MRRFALASSLLLAATSVAAQTSTRGVRGVVFDSVAGVPLSGAVVQVALTDSTRPPGERRVYSAVSDTAGRFMIGGLVPGHYVIGFQHDALLALGIESPVRAFDAPREGVVSLDLATPSAAVLRAVRCGDGDPQRPGMLSGYVTDARTGALSGGGTVEVQWTELGLKDRKLLAVPFTVRADIGEDGSFLACNLATDAMVSVRVAALGHRTLNGELVIPVSGVLRRDFTLADTSAVAGSSRISGKVVLSDGRPLPAGQAIITALGIEAPVTNGQFNLPGIPAGTWVVDARALGYEPRSAMVDVGEGMPASATIRLNARAQVLDAVSVVGKSNNKEISVLVGIKDRARMGSGTVFLPGSEVLKTAMVPADVVRFARGFRYLSPTLVHGRPSNIMADGPRAVCDGKCTTMRPDSSQMGNTMPNEPCSSAIDANNIAASRKRRVILYLDGVRFTGGLENLNAEIAMKDVLAIEAYPDVHTAPPQWRTPEACAIIAVWLKQ